MALVFSLTNDPANNLLEAHYSSIEIPFKNTIKMIATSAVVYHDNNQGSKVWEKLYTLEYDLSAKTMDIYQFIGIVNNLPNIAVIITAKHKTILFQHIPVNLNLHLLRDSKDSTISYKNFTGTIADIVKAK
jgi:hypothetical protein